jgi:hypothetical protein
MDALSRAETIQQMIQREENDIKRFALYCKLIRENRSERFVEDYLPALMLRYTTTKRDNGSYSIITEAYGTLDYFPKVNKVLIRKENKWIKPGLKWIRENLLN